MKTIWKFPLEITDHQKLALPNGAKPIHIGLDPQQRFCLWAEIDSYEVIWHEHEIFVVGTGNPIPKEVEHYMGSFCSGVFVWHVYAKF